jgi:hypothetical protein
MEGGHGDSLICATSPILNAQIVQFWAVLFYPGNFSSIAQRFSTLIKSFFNAQITIRTLLGAPVFIMMWATEFFTLCSVIPPIMAAISLLVIP